MQEARKVHKVLATKIIHTRLARQLRGPPVFQKSAHDRRPQQSHIPRTVSVAFSCHAHVSTWIVVWALYMVFRALQLVVCVCVCVRLQQYLAFKSKGMQRLPRYSTCYATLLLIPSCFCLCGCVDTSRFCWLISVIVASLFISFPTRSKHVDFFQDVIQWALCKIDMFVYMQ